MTTTFDTDPSLGFLVAYAPRVTVLPFLASFWFDGHAGFAIALTLVWHFVVAVPWYGLADCATENMRTAYFLVMPLIGVGFALLGWVLRNWFLKLPPHMTPVGHLLRMLRRGEHEPHEGEYPLPASFPIASTIVSLLVTFGAWLPSELLVYYGYDPAPIDGALFWVNVFVPPGAQLLPLVMWLWYGSALKKLFGDKRPMFNMFIAFLKCFLVVGAISTSFALIAKYESGAILWLWAGALCVAPGIAFCAFLYDRLTSDVRAHDYGQLAIY